MSVSRSRISPRYRTTGRDHGLNPRTATPWQREREGAILPMEEPRSSALIAVAVTCFALVPAIVLLVVAWS